MPERRPGRAVTVWKQAVEDFEEYLNNFVQAGNRPVGFAATPHWRPATDVYETSDAFWVVMELAGVDPGEVEVTVEGEMLTVSGTRSLDQRGQRRYHSMEIKAGPFQRRVRVGPTIDTSAIEATYDRGYLEVRLPKAVERPQAQRRIRIR